tara:strand:- start:214 stop:537 length:324 start_codon:yes stop_codon:yes gene_type:complete
MKVSTDEYILNVPMPFKFKMKANMQDSDIDFSEIEITDLEPYWLSLKDCVQEHIQEVVGEAVGTFSEDGKLKYKIQVEFETKFFEEEESIAEDNALQAKIDQVEEYA